MDRRQQIARIIEPWVFADPGIGGTKTWHAHRAARKDAALRKADAILSILSNEEKGWQDIASAPLDGSEVLTYRKAGLCAVAACWDGEWVVTDGMTLLDVTHWMPLPSPPTSPADGDGR